LLLDESLFVNLE